MLIDINGNIMKNSIGFSLLGAALSAVLFSCSIQATEDAQTSDNAQAKVINVITFDKKDLAGVDLPQVAPLPKETVLAGSDKNWQKLLYVGQVGVGIWQAEPMKLSVNPQTVDEYIYVLDGKLTLTSADGTVNKFAAGDSFVLPKGFVGTWETTGMYRQLIVVNPAFLGADH